MTPMTFRRITPAAYDESTGTPSGPPVETLIPGAGMFVQGDPQVYAAEELILSQNPCLLFAPSAYPLKAYTEEFLLNGDAVLLNGKDWKIKKVLSVVAPDGFVILSRIALVG